MHSIIKSAFYIIFIIISFVVSTNMLVHSKGNKKGKIFGFMVLLLAIGESFHLVPRILDIFASGTDNYANLIETGRFIASLSIVFVYFLLHWFWNVYKEESSSNILNIGLVVLGIFSLSLSVILHDASDTILVFLRNFPSLVIGVLVVLEIKNLNSDTNTQPFKFLWIPVLLTLVFTVSFELLSIPYPFFIILMMPKTLMNILIVVIGYMAYRKDLI